MQPRPAAPGAARGVLAVAALAIAALLFSLAPPAERLELAALDASWTLVRKFAPRAPAEEIVVVAIDEETLRRIQEPPGAWHEPLGKALARIAAARPRAIGLDFALPERSYDTLRPGLDRALLLGLAAARDSGPFVATLAIDPRTREARGLHAPYFAVLREERLGLGLLPRDADGVTRRFSLAMPTEDGAFPTFVGRLCRAMKRECNDGLLHFGLGGPAPTVPMHRVLDAADLPALERRFRDRIVLVGDTLQGGRIELPVAGAAAAGKEAPAIAVQALALRTALMQAAPRTAARPWGVLLAALAALVVLVRDWRVAAGMAVLALGMLLGAGALALRGGLALPVAPAMATAVIAWLVVAVRAWHGRYEIRRRD